MRDYYNSKRFPLLLLLFLLLLLAALVNLLWGSVTVSFPDFFSSVIILRIRLPRIVAAAVLGGGLALSGFLLQNFFQNPIAGPFVLGISSGAKFCVALCMILSFSRGVPLSSFMLVLAAFAGAMLSLCFVIPFSLRSRDMQVLVIYGIMVGYVCSAATDLLVTLADESNIVNLHNWSKGSFSGADWADAFVYVPLTAFSFLFCLFLAKPMEACQQGREYAESLGVRWRRLRLWIILLSSLLSACAAAFAGPISFLGVAVPHLMRRLFQSEKPLVMIPACFLGGAVFSLFCDFLSRMLFAPTELPISTVTAFFGAPVVIRMMLSGRRSSSA